jgi:hypothetical protein
LSAWAEYLNPYLSSIARSCVSSSHPFLLVLAVSSGVTSFYHQSLILQWCSSKAGGNGVFYQPTERSFLLSSLSHAVADSVWDYAPNFANDPFPPFPSLKNSDGTNITVESLRGTHLFGWKGCDNDEVNGITQAYNDFYTLAQQPEVYNSIDWASNAATDFWGPNNPPNVVPDDTRKEIQRELAEAFNTDKRYFEQID